LAVENDVSFEILVLLTNSNSNLIIQFFYIVFVCWAIGLVLLNAHLGGWFFSISYWS